MSLAQRPHFLWAPLEASPWVHSPPSAVRPARPRTGEICAALGKFWLHACPGYSPAFGALTSVCLFFKTWIHHQHPRLAFCCQLCELNLPQRGYFVFLSFFSTARITWGLHGLKLTSLLHCPGGSCTMDWAFQMSLRNLGAACSLKLLKLWFKICLI